jgi:hypothetical protein
VRATMWTQQLHGGLRTNWKASPRPLTETS